MTEYVDPILRMVVAAGTARNSRHFWTAIADMLREGHGVSSVRVEYSDPYGAGVVHTGDVPAGASPAEHVWRSEDDRSARVVVAPDVANAAVLETQIATAAELAALVGRRCLMEHERRIGTFLVELGHWLRTVSTDPRDLLGYALQQVLVLSAAHGAAVVEPTGPEAARVTATVGAGVPFRGASVEDAETVVTRVARSGRPELISRLADERLLREPAEAAQRLRAAMVVPLGTGAAETGVLSVFRVAGREGENDPFTQADLEELQAMVAHIGAALALARAVESATAAAHRLAAMAQASPLPLALVSETGTVLEANPAWLALFGVEDADRIRGRNLDAFTLTLDRATPAETIRLSASGVPWRGRAAVMRGDDHRKCEAIVTALADGTRYLVALHDRTEDIRRMRELVAKEKLETVSTIATGVAHEINNPLAAIRIEAELLTLSDTSPDVADAVRVIITEVDRAARIARELLRLARQPDATLDEVRVDQLAEGMVEVLGKVLAGEGIDLRGIVQPDLPLVLARTGDIELLLHHLIQNAEHAVERSHSPVIEVTARATDTGIRITVDDSGPGVEPSLWARVFDPFYTTQPPGKGRGLGLALCQRIVTELGGKLWVETGPLGGARFVAELPAARATD